MAPAKDPASRPGRKPAGKAAKAEPPVIVTLDTPIGDSGLPGARTLHKVRDRLGVHTVRELLFHLPKDHRDLRALLSAAELRWVEDRKQVSALLTVEDVVKRRVGRGGGRVLTEARLFDDTGSVKATWWGDRRFIEKYLRPGQTALFSGKVDHGRYGITLLDPEYQVEDGRDALHAGRLVPVYRMTEGLGPKTIRAATRAALDAFATDYPDSLPEDLRGDLPALGWAIDQLHYPADPESRDRARQRLAFEELLALQVGMVARRRLRGVAAVPRIAVSDAEWASAIGGVEQGIAAGLLPAEDGSRPERVSLTDDQRAALTAIRADLASGRPMLRLVQGDVGSGKTAVAAVAMATVAADGHQSALLAPTDLLARQHAATLARLLEPLGHGVVLMVGSATAAEKREARELALAPRRELLGATAGLVFVGTHALIQEAVAFHDLRLAVVDEQHRFGVADREALAAKGTDPHVLLMTATPIPRTLGQVLHADLDVSDIKAAPSGRKEVKTAVRFPDELVRRRNGQQGALAYLASQVAAGNRGFVIVPLVHPMEPDPDLPPPPGPPPTHIEAAVTLVQDGWEAACEAAGVPGTPLRLGIVHGQMRVAERDAVMAAFRAGDLDVVVGTTVLEVGVDIPDATAMIILDADRFGIAQLHQLRGRVGRGRDQAGCVLVSAAYPDPSVPDKELEAPELVVRRRLNALRDSTDGFALADLDLELRGEGRQLGLEQSGLPPLRVASLSNKADRELSVETRRVAEALVDEHGQLPERMAAFREELTRGWLRRVGAGDVLAEDELDG
ncbi:MAG: ATP-dependent DNA helicase RecG [Chloroflexota bacterium]